MSLARTVIAAVVCVPLAWLAITVGTSDIALQAGDDKAALARDPSSSDAAVRVAESEFQQGDAAAARATALQAVTRGPLSQPAIRALALAQEKLGNRDAAAGLMARAAALGWRDAPTQGWIFDAALKAGAWDAAAQRADALARASDAGAARLFPLIRRLAADPRSGPSMTARLAANPPWRLPFFYSATNLPASEFSAQDEMINALAATSAPMTRDESRAYISRLLIAGEIGHAREVWLSVPSVRRYAGTGAVYDGGFAHVTPGPDHILFEWALPSVAGVSAAVQPDATGNPGLDVSSDSNLATTVVAQNLILAPGAHMLAVDRIDRDPGAKDRYHWRLYCLPKGKPTLATVAGATRHGDTVREFTRFIVPPQDCDLQQLALRSEPGPLPGSSEARFDNVAIDP